MFKIQQILKVSYFSPPSHHLDHDHVVSCTHDSLVSLLIDQTGITNGKERKQKEIQEKNSIQEVLN